MDKQKQFTNLSDAAKQIAASYRFYDSAFRSLTTSPATEFIQKVLAERAALERASISSLASSLSQPSKFDFISSATCAMAEANTSIKSLFDATHSIIATMRPIIEEHNQWRAITKNLAVTNNLAELTLRRHTSEMFSASLAAQSKIMDLQHFRLGEAIQASESLQQSLRLGLDHISSTYNALFGAIGSLPITVAQFAPVVTRYPPLELFHEAKILEEITIPIDEQTLEFEPDVSVISDECSLEDWLHEIDPGLNTLLRGARQALTSANPDRVRHVTTSMRELFTHVVHHLAPDDAIRQWTSNDRYFHQGHPTRRARLLYICRQINFDTLSDFVDADVRSALTLVDALHSGTHGISPNLSERQLGVLFDRMESLLLFLLQLNAENE